MVLQEISLAELLVVKFRGSCRLKLLCHTAGSPDFFCKATEVSGAEKISVSL